MHRINWIRSKCKRAKSILDIGTAENVLFPGWENVTRVDRDLYNIPNFIQADAHDLPFEDQKFEVAVLAEILEHVEDPVQCINEALRVAERVIITVPFPEEWKDEFLPYRTIEEEKARTGMDLGTLIKRTNPSVKGVGGEKDGNFDYKFHKRWYSTDSFNELLANSNSKGHHISKISYNGWSFLTAESPHRMQIALLSTPYITTPPKHYGGLERVVADLAAGLATLGHDVTVFAAKGSKPIGDYEVVECATPLADFGTDWSKLNWYEAEKRMFHACREELLDFEVVNGHGWFGWENTLPKHTFHTHHGGITWESVPPDSTFIAISKHMENYSKQYFSQAGDHGMPITYAYNGIDLEAYPYDKKKKSSKNKRLIYVGRFTNFKGTLEAMQVARALKMPIDLVGGSHEPEYFELLEKEAELGDATFHINASHEKKIELLQNAHCLVMPSKMGEPFGLVAVEAMACGTPVVALRDGAIPELLTPQTGTVCDNAGQLVNAVKSIKSNPKACRKQAEKFSRENMAMEYYKIYNR